MRFTTLFAPLALIGTTLLAAPRALEPADYLQSAHLESSVSPDGRWALVLRQGVTRAVAEATRPAAELIEVASGKRRAIELDGAVVFLLLARPWSPDGEHVAIPIGAAANLTVVVIEAKSGKETARFGPFQGFQPNPHWITGSKLIIQGNYPASIPPDFSASLSVTERLEGWRHKVRGEASNVALDTRVPLAALESTGLWLLDVTSRTTEELTTCPPVVSVSVSPAKHWLAVLHEDTGEVGKGVDRSFNGATTVVVRDRQHTALFFALADSRLVAALHAIHFAPQMERLSGTTDLAWRNEAEALLVCHDGQEHRWMTVKLEGGAAEISKTEIFPDQDGRAAKSWLFAGDRLIFKSARDQWWVQRDGKVAGLRSVFPELAAEPMEVMPSLTAENIPTIVALTKTEAVRLGFGETPRVIRAIKLLHPFLHLNFLSYTLRGGANPTRASEFWRGRFFTYYDSNAQRQRVDVIEGAQLPLGADSEEVVLPWPQSGAFSFIQKEAGVETVAVVDGVGKSRDLAEANAFFREIPLPRKRPFTFTPDATKARLPVTESTATAYLPAETGGRALPTVIDIYLDRALGEAERLSDHAMKVASMPLLEPRFYTSHGYAYVVLDMPWKHVPGGPDPIDGVLAYVLPALEQAVALGIADRERIVFVGHSFGACNVFSLLMRTQIAKAAIECAGVFDYGVEWGSFGQSRGLIDGLAGGATNDVETQQLSTGGPPWVVPETFLRNSPSFHMQDIKTPTLIMAGEMDSAVTWENAKFAYQAYRRTGTPARLVVFYGEGHVINGPGNRAAMAREILDWLGNYIGDKRGEDSSKQSPPAKQP